MHCSKPIVRWTVGNVSKQGLLCLKISIKKFLSIYKNNFEYFLCFNNIDISLLCWIYNLNYEVKLIEQKSDYAIREYNPFWKLNPNRIDVSRHEIFIDNDLIIYNKIKEFDLFLERTDLFLITQGCRKKQNGFTYGFFENLIIKNDKSYNTGIIGIPPNYDFSFDICNTIKKFNILENRDLSFFDEQGMISYIFQNKNYILISNKIIGFFKNGECGIHLIGINKNLNKYDLRKYLFI